MFSIISFIILILCLIFQSSLLTRWPIWGIVPDLTLIIITCFSWQSRTVRGTGFGFLAGLMQDFLSLKSLGSSAISKTCTGFITGNFKGNSKSYLLPLFFVIINTIVNEIIHLLFYFALGTQKVLTLNIAVNISNQIFINIIFSPVFIIIFARLGKIFTPRKLMI